MAQPLESEDQEGGLEQGGGVDPLPDAQEQREQMGGDRKGARGTHWQHHQKPLELKHEKETTRDGQDIRAVCEGEYCKENGYCRHVFHPFGWVRGWEIGSEVDERGIIKVALAKIYRWGRELEQRLLWGKGKGASRIKKTWFS